MNDDAIPIPVIAAILTGAVSLVVFALNAAINGYRERLSRRREVFSKAYAATLAYEEFPYVVRRRGSRDAEAERIRISSELRRVQEELAYYSAWLAMESQRVADRYEALIAKLREIAGREVQRAWAEPAITSDAQMNMPDLGLSAIRPFRQAYLQEVSDHLSPIPRFVGRWVRHSNK